MMSTSFEDSLTDYETEVWHKYRAEVPLQRKPDEALDAYHRRVWERITDVWDWAVDLYEEGGAFRLGKEIEDLEEGLDTFGMELPGEDELVPLEDVRSNLRHWQRLRDDAETQVQAGNGDEQIGERAEERFNHILSRTTWRELLESAELAISERRETLDEGQFKKKMLRLRREVCSGLKDRARGTGKVEKLRDGTENGRVESSLEDEEENLPDDIFGGRTQSRLYAEEIVKKYQDDSGSLPNKMSRLMSWIGSDGEKKVKQLQRVFRKEGVSDRYEDGNPESFCELLERLLYQRHIP